MAANEKEDIVKKTMVEMGDKIPAKEKQRVENLLHEVIVNERTPREVMGFDDNLMEAVYTYGYNLHKTGNYANGEQIFVLLSFLDPSKGKYWIGLGACRQKQKKWKDAVKAYSKATMVDIIDPFPFFEIGECLLKLDDVSGAIMAYQAAINRTEYVPGYASLAGRAKLIISTLKLKMAGAAAAA